MPDRSHSKMQEQFAVGIDARSAVDGRSVIVDGRSVNVDARQVNVDARQINLTQFTNTLFLGIRYSQ